MRIRRTVTVAAVAALVVLAPVHAQEPADSADPGEPASPYRSVQEAESVVLVDSTGVRIQATEFGKLFSMPRLTAFHGDSEIDIPFDRIRMLSTGEVKDNRLPVTVRLTTGREMRVVLDRTEYEAVYGGQADFGLFRIRLEDIRTVEFLRPEPRAAGRGLVCARGHVYYNDRWRYCPYDGEELSARDGGGDSAR